MLCVSQFPYSLDQTKVYKYVQHFFVLFTSACNILLDLSVQYKITAKVDRSYSDVISLCYPYNDIFVSYPIDNRARYKYTLLSAIYEMVTI